MGDEFEPVGGEPIGHNADEVRKAVELPVGVSLKLVAQLAVHFIEGEQWAQHIYFEFEWE